MKHKTQEIIFQTNKDYRYFLRTTSFTVFTDQHISVSRSLSCRDDAVGAVWSSFPAYYRPPFLSAPFVIFFIPVFLVYVVEARERFLVSTAQIGNQSLFTGS